MHFLYIVFIVMATIEAVTASLRTDVGVVRERNEDFVGSWEPTTPEEQVEHGWLYIVADGVGGADAGDVASQHATEQTIRYYVSEPHDDVAERLRHAVQAANDDLRQLASQRNRSNYMATTIVAVAIRDGKVMFANVGDSRGYHVRDGAIQQVTKDQSLVAQLVEEGAITEEEALVHPRRNVILSSLGPTREPKIDLFDLHVSQGDILFLCSDGLTRHVSDEEIAEICQNEAPDAATRILIDLANERGGSDNVSVAILRVGDTTSSGRYKRPSSNRGSSMMNQDVELTTGSKSPVGLWVYALALVLVEAALIFIVWYLLRV